MQRDPRNDPAQQPSDPSVNPTPIEDPSRNPKDPCIKPPVNPEKKVTQA